MANQKIHEYLLERFSVGDDDYFDIDYFDGAVYSTAKVKGSVIKALASGSVNIYNTDGTLTADRTLTGDNLVLLFQTMGQFIVESHKNGVDGNIIFEVRSDPTDHSFIIRDHNTNVHILACKDGKVEISDNYFLPSVDGTNGQVMKTDGAGNVTFQNETINNIYTNDGTLAGDRSVSGGGTNGIGFIDVKIFAVSVTPNVGATAGAIYSINTTNIIGSNAKAFSIQRSQDLVNLLNIITDGRIQIGNSTANTDYILPNSRGTTGQVLTMGSGSAVQWSSAGEEFIPKVSGFNVSRYHIFTNGSSTVFHSGLLSGGVGGTQAPLLLAGTTATKIIRSRFTSATSSGSIAGYRGNGTDIVIGMGFHAIFTFGFGDTTYNSAAHNWIGFGNAITFQIGSLTFASSLGNIIGVGNDPSDTTLQIMHNNSSGTAIKTPLGSDFPANRSLGAAFTGMFCFELFNDFGSQDVKWRITRIDTGTVEQGIITSTDKPSSSTFLSPVVSRCNGTSTTIAAIMDVAAIQIHTKY